MNDPETNRINEIAQELDCGFRAYIHKSTAKLLFIPNDNNLPYADLDAWEDELKTLAKNPSDYVEVVKWTSSEAFGMMREFTDQLTENNLQIRLYIALKKNKPFREFNFVIDNSGDNRQLWFDFKMNWQMDFVARQLNRLKSAKE